MKRLMFVLALAASGCHPPISVTTPQGQIAYRADQVAVRINELQNAVIAANGQGQLSESVTRTIVQFCVGANPTLAATPAGWKGTLTTAWQQTKAALPPITNPAVVAAMGAVDVILAGVTP